MNHTILCQARTDLNKNGRLDQEEAVLFVEPPLIRFPHDGEDENCFTDAEKDPLEL